MMLKGSQRGGGQDLAVHLMRADDNEHISLHELRGFASDTLKDAFKEIEAISRGTKCQQYLFSLSLSPPEQERVEVAAFERAIAEIEERLGLQGQPRAIVFHEKEGRRHAHCVWSRIDAETMTARPLSFFKKKLMAISRDLYLEHGWHMPRGIALAGARDPTNFTLAEWQQAKRQGVDPRWLKQTLQACWSASDTRRAFEQALQEHGLFLARGDKRGFVILDHDGEIHALPRLLDLKTKEVRARLGDGADLPGVEATKQLIGQRMSPAIRRHIAEARSQFQAQAATLNGRKAEMTRRHRQARHDLQLRQEGEWRNETLQRAARLPKGLRGLWYRLTGKYQEIRRQNQAEARLTESRHAEERQQLVDTQLSKRASLQTEIKQLRRHQAEQLVELRQEIGRYLRFSHKHHERARSLSTGLELKLER